MLAAGRSLPQVCFGWLDLSGKPGLQSEAPDYRGMPDGRKRFPLLCVWTI